MLLIKNGKVLTMGPQGVLENADVLIGDDGKIMTVGMNLTAEGAQVIDASGKVVMPGLVDAHSHIGGFDTDSGAQDLNELTRPTTPEIQAYDAINPLDRSFTEAIRAGITTSAITPGSGNVICGLACAVKSGGHSLASRTLRNPIALKAAMGVNPKGVYGPRTAMPMSRLGVADLFRDYFLKVRDYMKKKEEGKSNPEVMPKRDPGLENGVLVLEKKIPLKVHCYQHDMMSLLQLADEFDFDVTLDHALGASDFYDEIAENPHVRGVIYGPLGAPLFGGEGCKLDIECLAELDRRGVCCAIMTDGPCFVPYMIVTQTGEAVRAGMNELRALRMITINAARIIGCDDRVGSLEPGKDGDVVIFQGMPVVDTEARNTATIIDGRLVWSENAAE